METLLKLLDLLMDLLTLGFWSRRRGSRLYYGKVNHDR